MHIYRVYYQEKFDVGSTNDKFLVAFAAENVKSAEEKTKESIKNGFKTRPKKVVLLKEEGMDW